MSGPCTDCGGPDYQTLDARIAELDAENERLMIALVAIQSTTPGSAHRIAIQALAIENELGEQTERGTK